MCIDLDERTPVQMHSSASLRLQLQGANRIRVKDIADSKAGEGECKTLIEVHEREAEKSNAKRVTCTELRHH